MGGSHAPLVGRHSTADKCRNACLFVVVVAYIDPAVVACIGPVVVVVSAVVCVVVEVACEIAMLDDLGPDRSGNRDS